MLNAERLTQNAKCGRLKAEGERLKAECSMPNAERKTQILNVGCGTLMQKC
jgi:hypothetical protein